MCGESWVARQRPQRRRGRATVPPVDPAARVRVREAQAAGVRGPSSGEGPIMSRYRNQVPPRVHRFNEAGPEQGSVIKFAPPASVPMKPIEATVAAAVGGRPGRSPRLSGAPLVRSARPWAPPSPVERQR